MSQECVFYAAIYSSSDRGVRFGWESIFAVTTATRKRTPPNLHPPVRFSLTTNGPPVRFSLTTNGPPVRYI